MKNRNIPYYVASLMLAAGVSTSFVSCVDTDEPSSITKLREAKANEVNAQAAYENALAQTQLQTAEIEKQKAAQAAIQTQMDELARQARESKLAVEKKADELAILQNENKIAHEKAQALVTAQIDSKNLSDNTVDAIDAALKLEAKVAEKEAELKYLKDKAEADLADSYTSVNRKIEETKVKLKQIELDYTKKGNEQADSVLKVLSETDEVAQNLRTAKENTEGLLTATFDGWIQAKFNLIKAQATLAEEQYKASVSTVKDTIGYLLDAATEKAAGGVETQKLTVAAKEDNLKKLQDLKDNTDYQAWLKAYNDADNYIKVDIENKQIARKTTLAEKQNLKTAADNALTKATAAYTAYTEPFDKKLTDYDAKSAFYKYDISAADYATLVSYITDKQGAWAGKAIAGSDYTIEQAKDTKAEGQHFVYDAASKQFVSIKQEITNADFKKAIAELYAVDDNDPEKITGVIGQFIAKTKEDKNSKKTAEQDLKDLEKDIFRSENVTAELDLAKITDERALAKKWNDAKTNYNTAFENLRTAKKNYNTAKAAVETKKKEYDKAVEALNTNTDDSKTVTLTTARDNAKTAWDNAVTSLNGGEDKDKNPGAILALNGDGTDKHPGAIPTYNKAAEEFDVACKNLFGDDYGKEANKFSKTLVTENDLDDVKYGLKLQEAVEGGVAPTGFTAATTVKTAPRFVLELPDRLKAEELSVILDGKTLTDYKADIYGTTFGIASSKYVQYLRKKNIVVPEWTNKIKADEEAAKFVSTVKSHVNVADAATAELSIVETLKQLETDRAKLKTAVYEARYTEEGKKLLADVESKKAAASVAADSVAKYDEYKNATTPKAVVDQAIKEEKAAKETLMATYTDLIETVFKKASGESTYKFDAEKYAEAYAKAEIKLEKELADAKADLAVAEAKLEAARKGEVYTPAAVTAKIVTIIKGTDGKYTAYANDQNILADGNSNTYEAYIAALKKAVDETQANVDDLKTQYDKAKEQYEEALKQVAAYLETAK